MINYLAQRCGAGFGQGPRPVGSDAGRCVLGILMELHRRTSTGPRLYRLSRLTYLLSITFWSLFTLLQGFATGLYSLIALRLGVGLSEAPRFSSRRNMPMCSKIPRSRSRGQPPSSRMPTVSGRPISAFDTYRRLFATSFVRRAPWTPSSQARSRSSPASASVSAAPSRKRLPRKAVVLRSLPVGYVTAGFRRSSSMAQRRIQALDQMFA